MWTSIRGYVAAGIALITCPCHLPITLPILLSLTAGTAVGAFLRQHTGLVWAVSAAIFVGGLALALFWLAGGSNTGESGDTCRISDEEGAVVAD